MDIFKRFLQNKKLDKKFKNIGPGHSLIKESSSSSRGQSRSEITVGYQDRIHKADVATAAALKRMDLNKLVKPESRSQKTIRMQVKREIDESHRHDNENYIRSELNEPKAAPIFDVKGVFFTCDILDDDIVLSKEQLKEVVGEFLEEQLNEEPLVASVLIVNTLNKLENRRIAVETLTKIVENLINHPEQEKYRRIRLSNRLIQEKVTSIKGAEHFLLAIGFEKKKISPSEGEIDEEFLIISEDKALDTQLLQQAKDALVSGTSVPRKLHRNPGIFKLTHDGPLPKLNLPDEFFNLTADEIKKEQQRKSAEVDKVLALRTREMRKRDEVLSESRYKYALIRVKFPDSFVLEGTFLSREKLTDVKTFIQMHLAEQGLTFLLRDSAMGVLLDSSMDEKTLGSLKLAPAAWLRFEYDREILANLGGNEGIYLKKELLVEAKLI